MRYTKSYSKANCVFECQSSKAFEKCSCIPWNYPRLETQQICDYQGTLCFENVTQNAEDCEDGNMCMEPCKTMTYSYMALSKQIDYETECEYLSLTRNTTEYFPIAHPLHYLFTWQHSDRQHLTPKRFKDWQNHRLMCQLSLKATSILHIKPGTQRVSVVTQRLRVTFSDQLSAFGEQ